MQIVIFLVTVYMLIGFIYALYLLAIGTSKLRQFPINMIAGPIMLIYLYKAAVNNTEIKIGN